jgi:hypothetical protein
MGDDRPIPAITHIPPLRRLILNHHLGSYSSAFSAVTIGDGSCT